MTKRLTVWWDSAPVGALSVDRHGEMRFAYVESWLGDPAKPPLSFSLPKRAETFSRRECRPFFDGLLPEAMPRDAVARALGVSAANEFKLLEALGGDVAGALTIWPEGEAPPSAPERFVSRVLPERELIDLLDTLPVRPFLAGDSGLRLSLAGAQSKIPVVLERGEIALPAPGQPTTHILKPPIERLEGTTENEALCMRLAASLGLSVAPVEIRTVGNRRFLLVERYDRARNENGRIIRLHQEDFCQALGVPPDRKYAAEGGPTFKDCFDLLRRAATRPAVEVLKLLDAAIFNLMIGNADAHGKNFSLIHRNGAIELAPLYDLLCTVAYSDLSPKMAMKYAGRTTLEDIRPADWDKFAEEIGMSGPFVRRRIEEVGKSIIEVATRTRTASGVCENGFATNIWTIIKQRKAITILRR